MDRNDCQSVIGQVKAVENGVIFNFALPVGATVMNINLDEGIDSFSLVYELDGQGFMKDIPTKFEVADIGLVPISQVGWYKENNPPGGG